MRIPLAAVAAAAALGCSDSGPINGNPKQVPPPPAAVSAKIENGNVSLSWADVPDATSFNVYMAAEAGVKRVTYASLAGNMFHPGLGAKFDHPAGLDLNTKYFFVVTAVNEAGESAESCEVGAEIGASLGESC